MFMWGWNLIPITIHHKTSVKIWHLNIIPNYVIYWLEDGTILLSSYPSKGLLHQNHRNTSHHLYHFHPIFHLHLGKECTCTKTIQSWSSVQETICIGHFEMAVPVYMVGHEFNSIYLTTINIQTKCTDIII